MSEQGPARRFRSPPFPSLSLQQALDRAEQLYRQERDHWAPLSSAAKAWSMSPTSSGPITTLGALRQYGLVEDEGAHVTRKVRVTHDALRIILDKVPTSPSRLEALQRAFLAPKIFQELWARWKTDLPSEQTMVNYLVLDRRLNNQAPYSEQSASELLANYRASMAFAAPADAPNVVSTTEGAADMEAISERVSAFTGGVSPIPPTAAAPQAVHPAVASSAYAGMDGDLSVLLKGGRLQIGANVDLEGLKRLKEVLGKYEEILALLHSGEGQH